MAEEQPWEAPTTELWLRHMEDQRFGDMADAQDRKNCVSAIAGILGIVIAAVVVIGGIIYFAGWR
jgi:hypothetical protein